MKRFWSVVFILSIYTSVAVAQVKVTAQIDSAEIMLGEQTAVRVQVIHPAGLAVSFPKDISVLLDKNLEVVNKGEFDEHDDTPEEGMSTSDFTFTVTSFEPALYYIPQFNITVGKKSYSTNQLALKVNDVAIDTLHVDKFFGPKEIIVPTYTWRDWMPMLILSVMFIVCLGIGAYLFHLMRSTKQVKAVKIKKTFIPPHKEAARDIEKLKTLYADGNLSSKEYYTELITILRKYVSKRYGIHAKEMTSYELVECLINQPGGNDVQQLGMPEQSGHIASAEAEPDYNELREILTTADLTKFAKLQTDSNEDRLNLLRLSNYINATKSETQQPITTEEKSEAPVRNIQPRLILRLLFALSVLAAITIALLMIKEAYELLL